MPASAVPMAPVSSELNLCMTKTLGYAGFAISLADTSRGGLGPWRCWDKKEAKKTKVAKKAILIKTIKNMR
jgi:hypothetical protein